MNTFVIETKNRQDIHCTVWVTSIYIIFSGKN